MSGNRDCHNDEQSRSSYERNQLQVSKNRILERAHKGSIIRKSTIDNPKYEWTEKELGMLRKTQENVRCKMYVPQRSNQFMERNKDRLSARTNGFVEFMTENLTNQSHLYAKNKCVGKRISVQDMIDAFSVLIDRNLLLKDKSDTQKRIGKQKYGSKISTALKIYGTDNVLDIYVYPERFFNKLTTSHLSSSSVKDYLSLFVSFYKKSSEFPSNERRITPTIRELQTMVPLLQLKPLQDGMKRTIKLSKEHEMVRLESAPSYRWADIKRIPDLIAAHPESRTVSGLRDQVIARFYIEENVLRDNLGAIVVGNREPKDKETTLDAIRNKPNYLNLKTGILHLNDFKTNTIFKDFKLRISDDTLRVVEEYLSKVEETTGNRPTHLITKDDGSMYKDGKLSSYISIMFKNYTKVDKIAINDLRHSVATHHRNSSQRIKEYIAYLLQHSYLQHIRYERHSDEYLEFPVNDLRSSEHDFLGYEGSESTRQEQIDATYLRQKVLVVVQSGQFKGNILAGRVRLNESNTKDSYRYQVCFYDKKIGTLNTNLPNQHIVLA